MKWIPPMPKGSLSHLRIGTSRFPKDAANPMDAVKQAMLTGTTAPAAGLSSRYRARMGAVWRYNSLPPKDLVETASLRMHLLLPPLGVLSRRGTLQKYAKGHTKSGRRMHAACKTPRAIKRSIARNTSVLPPGRGTHRLAIRKTRQEDCGSVR